MTNAKKQHSADLLERDRSLIDFNARVLSWAERDDVPLLERLRFLTIVSSNLDEFFEVRMASHLLSFLDTDVVKDSTAEEYLALSKKIHKLVSNQYQIFNRQLLPDLMKVKLKIANEKQRTKTQTAWVRDLFVDSIQPLLVPMVLDPSHPFPQVPSKALNYIVRLSGENVFGRSNEIAIIQVPRMFPRFFEIPSRKGVKQRTYSSLSSIVREHLPLLFPGHDIQELSQFRVTRHSDIAFDEDEVKSLSAALRTSLQTRPFGRAMRLEIAENCSPYLERYLMTQFAIPVEAVYRVRGPVNLVRTRQLIDLIARPDLEFKPYKPSVVRINSGKRSVFERLSQKDIVLHHPYQSFSAVHELLETAVKDRDVVAIQMTIYRSGSDGRIVDLLKEAVRRGKMVMAVVELKARFDEEANIRNAEELGALGVQVVYGVHGLKTHSKMLLITRREGSGLKRYCHLSTGNYNSQTARLYTDLGFLTSNVDICHDVDHLFKHLASQTHKPPLRKLLLAPFDLFSRFIEHIQECTQAAKKGDGVSIACKMNSLTDPDLAKALNAAAEAGAQVDLCVRGACILRPIEGKGSSKGRIRVRSIIGRFLEHSRVYNFSINGVSTLYLSSADMMSRNMHGRIEIAWPIEDEKIKKTIFKECLELPFDDTKNGWSLELDDKYLDLSQSVTKRKTGTGQLISSQEILMNKYGRA